MKEQKALEQRFEPQGALVRWIEFAFGPPLLEALGAGAIDYVYTGESPPILLDEPTAGKIAIAGGSEGRTRLARIMFQEPRLLPWARLDANVAVGFGPAADHAEALHRSRDALATVGLANRGGEWPSILSGGQKQRVALARARQRPHILALDEPLGALDALTRIEMQRLVEQVWLSKGFTAILVTHDAKEAVALGDRVVVIDQGAITADIPIDLPRPRQRGSVEFARLEAELLKRLLAAAY